tara:strand:- start:3015 stop:4376 length:1362 start_codon:yes stop_codon:yes gene_type:complete
MEKELISIIIRTKNEERWIESCLEKIYDQKKVKFEIIIVDNYSTDKTVQVVSKISKHYKNIKILKIKKFLPGKAINLGINSSNGNYVCCLSAHCIPYDDLWLYKLKKNLKSNKKVAAVYGRQVPLPYTSDVNKRDLLNTFGLDRKIQKKDSFFHNANSMFKKNIWKKLNFDNHVTNIEDRVWAHHILKLGYYIIYEPQAKVYHFHGIHQDMDLKRCSNIVKIMENLDSTFKETNYKKISDVKTTLIIPSKGQEIFYNKKSLINKTINQGLKSKLINKVVISSDNQRICKKFKKKYKNVISILRPKSLSLKYIDILTVSNFTLKKLEKKKLFSDYIIIATPNFPFRKKELFDNLIKRIHSSNNDFIFGSIEEKGLLWNQNSKKNILVNESLKPKYFKKNKNFVSKFGYGIILRPSIIRNLSVNNLKTSTYKISNNINCLDIYKDCNINLFNAED